MRYVLSYYYLREGQWHYDANIVEADSPRDIELPSDLILYMVQVEEYKVPVK